MKNMELEGMVKAVNITRWIVGMIFGLSVGTYFVWFWLINGHGFSQDSAIWGSFGDFVGGILNPLIAFCAFYWLTISVSIQKAELKDTKQALVDSSMAHKKQSWLIENQIKINTEQTRLTAININLEAKYAYRNVIISSALNGSGYAVPVFDTDGNRCEPKDLLVKIETEIEKLIEQQQAQINQIEELSKEKYIEQTKDQLTQ